MLYSNASRLHRHILPSLQPDRSPTCPTVVTQLYIDGTQMNACVEGNGTDRYPYHYIPTSTPGWLRVGSPLGPAYGIKMCFILYSLLLLLGPVVHRIGAVQASINSHEALIHFYAIYIHITRQLCTCSYHEMMTGTTRAYPISSLVYCGNSVNVD